MEGFCPLRMAEHQAVRTKPYDWRPYVTPSVRDDLWMNACGCWLNDRWLKICVLLRMTWLPDEVLEVPLDWAYALFPPT